MYVDNRRCAVCDVGRIVGKHCSIIANMGPWDGSHALAVPNIHNPLWFGQAMITDMLLTSVTWCIRTHALHRDRVYPVIILDALPRASASQLHNHYHLTLSPNRYTGMFNMYHCVASRYGANYYSDVVAAHEALGLVFMRSSTSSCVAMASLTARKEKEVMIMCCLDAAEDEQWRSYVSGGDVCQWLLDAAECYAHVMRAMVECRM